MAWLGLAVMTGPGSRLGPIGLWAVSEERGTVWGMCRNIRPLFNFEPPAYPDEMHDAALQYVRKISGMNKPSIANQAAFDEAVAEIEAATQKLIASLTTTAAPKDREEERTKARARNAARFGTPEAASA